MQLLDTNVILRFILKDHPRLSPLARTLVKQKSIYLDPVVIAEVVWVCKSVYQLEKSSYIPPLLAIVDLPTNKSRDKKLLVQALEYYVNHNISYIDCWLLILSQAKSLSLATFDAKLSKQK